MGLQLLAGRRCAAARFLGHGLEINQLLNDLPFTGSSCGSLILLRERVDELIILSDSHCLIAYRQDNFVERLRDGSDRVGRSW